MKIDDPHIGQIRYAVIGNGVFGKRVVYGLVTGIRFTDSDPIYSLQYQKNRWEVKRLYSDRLEMLNALEIPYEDTIGRDHGLDINFP